MRESFNITPRGLKPATPRIHLDSGGAVTMHRDYTQNEASRTLAYALFLMYMFMYAVCGSSTALMLVDIVFDQDTIPEDVYEWPDPRAVSDSGVGGIPTGFLSHGTNVTKSSYAYPLDVATYYYGPHFMAASVFTIISGQLIDGGVHEKWLLFGAGVTLGVGLLLLPQVMQQRQHRGSQGVANPVMAILSGSFRGISLGLREPVRLSVLSKYFGRAHLAEITSSTRMYHMLGIALGPLIISGLFCINILSLLPLHLVSFDTFAYHVPQARHRCRPANYRRRKRESILCAILY
jgi:hypothetical protein